MKHIKLYENFNFNEDDFDFEEEQPTTTFQIGDAVEFVNNENVIITMVNNLRNSSNSIGTKAYVLDIKIHNIYGEALQISNTVWYTANAFKKINLLH